MKRKADEMCPEEPSPEEVFVSQGGLQHLGPRQDSFFTKSMFIAGYKPFGGVVMPFHTKRSNLSEALLFALRFKKPLPCIHKVSSAELERMDQLVGPHIRPVHVPYFLTFIAPKQPIFRWLIIACLGEDLLLAEELLRKCAANGKISAFGLVGNAYPCVKSLDLVVKYTDMQCSFDDIGQWIDGRCWPQVARLAGLVDKQTLRMAFRDRPPTLLDSKDSAAIKTILQAGVTLADVCSTVEASDELDVSTPLEAVILETDLFDGLSNLARAARNPHIMAILIDMKASPELLLKCLKSSDAVAPAIVEALAKAGACSSLIYSDLKLLEAFAAKATTPTLIRILPELQHHEGVEVVLKHLTPMDLAPQDVQQIMRKSPCLGVFSRWGISWDCAFWEALERNRLELLKGSLPNISADELFPRLGSKHSVKIVKTLVAMGLDTKVLRAKDYWLLKNAKSKPLLKLLCEVLRGDQTTKEFLQSNNLKQINL